MNRTGGEEANMKNMFSDTTALIEVPTDMFGLFTIDQLFVDSLRSWDDAFQFTIRVVSPFDDLADRYLPRMTNEIDLAEKDGRCHYQFSFAVIVEKLGYMLSNQGIYVCIIFRPIGNTHDID